MISNPRQIWMVLLPETSSNAIYDRIPKWGDWIKFGIEYLKVKCSSRQLLVGSILFCLHQKIFK